MQSETHLEIDNALRRINSLWGQLLSYAREIETRSNKYVSTVQGYDQKTLEQARGLLSWVSRTKGSYESKLWEMEVLLNHMGEQNVEAYLGYDNKTHPDVAIVNRKANTAVAIEIKQVESIDATQVHPNVYGAMDQLFERVEFDNATPYTRWKAYIYINAGNPWPWTKPADQAKDFKTLVAEKGLEQKKTAHWKAKWHTLTDVEPKIEVSVWHADHGREDYVLTRQ